MCAANSKEGIMSLFEHMEKGFENRNDPLIPDERRRSSRPVTDEDAAILSEISNTAYAQSYNAEHERKLCQELLDERWPEMKCDYDETVAWLIAEIGH